MLAGYEPQENIFLKGKKNLAMVYRKISKNY